MRWTNKGSEFDNIGEKIVDCFNNRENIFIYGAGNLGGQVPEAIKPLKLLKGFIDSDIKKQEKIYLGYKVHSPEEFFKYQNPDKCTVIIAASVQNTPAILEKLSINGYVEGVNCFKHQEFIDYYLPILFTYKYNKAFLNTNTIMITELCSLKCKDCSLLIPYIKSPTHRNLSVLKKDIDLYFSKIDFTYRWTLTGGEPLLYPNLKEIIEYVGINYSEQIGTFQLFTNGTVLPPQDILDVLKKYKVSVTISDYSDQLARIENKISQFENYLKNYNIRYIRQNSADKWVDYGFAHVNRTDHSEADMIKFFDYCKTPCRGYKNGLLFYCINAHMLNKIHFNDDSIDGYINLNNCLSSYKKDILEFNLGYNDRGYLHACRKCNGYVAINKNFIQAAIQL